MKRTLNEMKKLKAETTAQVEDIPKEGMKKGIAYYCSASLTTSILFGISLFFLLQQPQIPADSAFKNSKAVFWAIADIHIASDYVEGSDPKTFCTSGTGKAGKFGFFNCDPPYDETPNSVLGSALNFISSKATTAKFIVWLGDSSTLYSEHPKIETRTEEVESMMEWNNFNLVAHAISSVSIPVYPTLGNHDHHPADSPMFVGNAIENDKIYLAKVASVWGKEFKLKKSSLETIKYGGYYTEQTAVSGLTIASLNTLLCWDNSQQPNETTNVRDQFALEMLSWLSEILDSANQTGNKVLIIGHVPPIADSTSFKQMWTQLSLDQYSKIIQQYQNVIAGQIFGHVHLDFFSVLRNKQGNPIGTAIIVPSLTTRASSKPPESGQNEGKHPAVRLFALSNDNEIMDWIQFFANLTEANTRNANALLKWTKSYSACEEFGTQKLSSPKQFEEIGNSLQQNKTLLCDFVRHLVVEQPFPQCSNSMCQRLLICSTLYSSSFDLGKCMKTISLQQFSC